MAGDRPDKVVRGGLLLDVVNRTTAPADILIAGDRVTAVGAPGLDAPDGVEIIDAADRLIMPGLINAHTHGHGSLGKGLGDRWSLELLLNALPWAGGGMSLEDKKLAAQLNAAEMILKGCTAAYDMFFEFPTPTTEGMTLAIDAYRDVGVRVRLAPMMADTTFYRAVPGLLDSLPEPHRARAAKMSAATHTEHLAACTDLLDGWTHDRDWARPALGPTIPTHCTDDFIRGCRDLARDYGAGIQMHVAESKAQAVAGLERYGKSMAAHLNDLGLIGPDFVAAHGVWLDDADLALMADRGASVAHNPGSNMRLGSGVARAVAMRDAGVTFGIGTDGSASSDNQNMFEAMRDGAVASRLHTPDPDGWLGTWDVIDAATLGGAKVMGMDDLIGRIAPGYKADLVFLDLGNVNFVPLNDAANQIVNCEDSSAVDSVMVDGRMVLSGRRFVDFDFAQLRRAVNAAAGRLGEANAETQATMEAMAPFVSTHCVGLACRGHHVHAAIHGAEIRS